MYASIAGTGSYLPARVITNADFERVLDTTDAWIRERTGIERRRRAADNETTVDMGEHAARAAIAAAGLQPEQIDLIIFGTTTPDLVFPNCGTLLQARLGCRGAPAFSVEAACSGFIYALAIADQFVRGGQSQRALVVGSEKLSCITDHGDRSTAILFGDGAGAVVLTPHEHRGIISTHLHSDGSYASLLTGTGGVAKPVPDGARPVIRMAGGEVFKLAVNKLGQIVDETLHANGLDKSAIDWLVPHQANIRIIQAISRKLDMPMERVIVTVAEHGNTSTASVPLAFDTGVRDGRIKRGELLLLEAFGGGLTWGSALIRF